MNSSKITIVLADDHPILRRGVRTLLEAHSEFNIVGEADEGLTAIRLVERLAPAILVVDLCMPGLNGLEVARTVCRRSPTTRTIILSAYADESYVRTALRYGAVSYVLKDAAASELIKAVREAAAGRRYLSAPFSDNAIELYVQKALSAPADPYEELTDREREVLQLAVEGGTNTEIGHRLFISPRTVEVHRARMMRKLGLRNQTEMVCFAMGRGILLARPEVALSVQ